MTSIEAKIVAHSIQAQGSWESAYGRFARRIEERGLRCGVEIGVAFGGHAESILAATSVEKLYGVDPYRHMDGYDDPMNLPQEEFDELYRFTVARLSRFGPRYEHIRALSGEAANRVHAVDFVYIDADHSYAGVWRDLSLWFPKVRAGGLIGGHDYDHRDFPGVRCAVDEFLGHLRLKATHDGEGVWWTEKPLLTQSEEAALSSIRPAGMPVIAVPRKLKDLARKAARLFDLG
jgi:hypothetical protein